MRRGGLVVLVAVLVAFGFAFVVARGPDDDGDETAADDVTTTAVPPTVDPAPGARPADPPRDDAAIEALVARLAVASEDEMPGYERELFPHWSMQADGCDTRDAVLIEEAIGNVQRDVGCTIVAGDWVSPYDGVEVDDPANLQIDHVVALHEAWQSGAAEWDEARREAFANDLGYPGALVAVTGDVNQSKSDRDPAEWRPPRRDAWCQFATDWINVKVRWELTADESEVRSLADMLQTCLEPPQ
jgi:hypothetical protein